MTPESFDEDIMEQWGRWVLDHGLPKLPDRVDVGESVPVARWVGPRFAAVMHIQWMWTEDHADDYLSTETQVFVRAEDDWIAAGGSGGSDWWDPPFVRPSAVGPRAVRLGNVFFADEGDWSCCAVDGLVGSDARAVEVEDADGCTRNPVESPFGAVVICSDGRRRARYRVLDAEGVVLGSAEFGGRY